MRLAFLLFFISLGAAGQDKQGLRFIENKGQWGNEIDFGAKVPGGKLGVSAKGFSVMLLDLEEVDHRHLATHHVINEFDGHGASEAIEGHYFQINLIGSNLNSKAVGQDKLDGHYNFFLGNDSCKWATNAQAFTSILYKNVYDGIDFRVSSVGNNLKYDFIVKPGADPSQIKLEYCGADRIDLDDEHLKITTVLGTLTELKPFSYQLNNGKQQHIPSAYRLTHNVASFYFPEEYDECRELVIDPLLIFSTYSGSLADNWGSTATPGEHGTLYSAGVTRQEFGRAFPTTTGAFQTENRGSFDMAIIKYDSAGTKFLYATLLGGSGNDSPQSLVVDQLTGDLLVLGISSSSDYPTREGSFDQTFNQGNAIFNRVLNTTDEWDIVVTRLSPNGDQLVGSTFLGGSDNDGLNFPKQSGGPLVVNYGDEMRGDIITDETGHVYISSVTSSADFPIIGGFDSGFGGGTTDGVVVKLAPDLSSIIWSSYIGGSGFDAAYSIKFDSDQNIILAGGTTSPNFPVTAGAYQTTFKGIVDGWVTRVAADGSAILNSTLTGTQSFDQVYFVDLNSAGDIFCYGQTAGNMPITPGKFSNPNSGQFLQKFSADLSTLKYSTVFGSGTTNGLVIPNISPTAFLVNDCDNIYMAGWGGHTNSSPNTGFWQSSTHGMPITPDAHQKTTTGSDFYFIVLNGDATELVYSTYFGGNASKTHVDGGTSRFDKYGIVYHSVCSGCTFGNTTGGSSSDFPTTPDAKSRINRSTNCNNAAFKFDLSSLRAMFDTNNLALTKPGFNNVCYPDSIVFQNFSTGGRKIEWDFGDGTRLTQDDEDGRNIIHQYKEAGQYRVKLKITDLSTCSQTDSTFKVINYFKGNMSVVDDGPVCEGAAFQLGATGGIQYTWSGTGGTFSSTEQAPKVYPTSAASYYVTVVDANGCTKKDTVNVSFIPNVRAAFQTYDISFEQAGFNNVCFPEQIRFKNLSMHGVDFIWDFGDGTTLPQMSGDTASVLHGFQQQGVYRVTLKVINPSTCNQQDIAVKDIHYFNDKITVGPDGEICAGTTFQLAASGGSTYLWSSEHRSFTSSAPAPLVKPDKSTKYFVTVTDANGCIRKDTVHVAVLDSVGLKWQHRLIGNCTDIPAVLVQNLSPPEDDVTFRFDFGDGTVSSDREVEHHYKKDGSYSVKLVAQRKFCVFEDDIEVPIYHLVVPNVFTPEGSPGLNDKFELRLGEKLLSPADAGFKVQLIVLDRWGKKVYESNDYQNNWRGDGVAGGVYFIHLRIGDLATCKNWVHIVK